MSRARQVGLLLGGLALLALVVYLSQRTAPQLRPPSQSSQQPGLAWLSAEAGVVGSVDLARLRKQAWLLESVESATGEATQESAYREFVAATGFDYSRDLDQVWFALFADKERVQLAGVAEGRFARLKVLGYARQQGAREYLHEGFEVYEWQTTAAAPNQSPRSFAVAFLDDAHLAFASDREQAMRVIECWRGRSPAVGTEEAQRAEIVRLASGHQAWAVIDMTRWSKNTLGLPLSQSDLAAVMSQLAVGLTVAEQGVELVAEARCHETPQAERLRDNLRVMILVARVALARENNELSRLLREALGDLTLEQREDRLEARVSLAPATLAALLRAAPTTAQRR